MAKSEVNRRAYLEQFLRFRCAGDVLNAVGPLSAGSEAITQSMAIFRVIRPLVMKNPNQLNLVEMCAGNALAAVLAIHTLPIKEAFAFNTRLPKGTEFRPVKRFKFLDGGATVPTNNTPTILIARRGNGECAIKATDLFRDDPLVKMLVVIPMHAASSTIELLATHGREAASYTIRDRHIMSPARTLVVATRP